MDVFGDEEDEEDAPVPLLPRASDHPHFASCRTLWPVDEGPADDASCELDHALRSYADRHADRVAKGLHKSRSEYGRACAKSLLAANEAFISGGAAAEALGRHARAAADFCATAIEERNWDTPAWQEANLLALCYQLAALLAEVACDAQAVTQPSAPAEAQSQAEADRGAEAGPTASVRIGAAAIGIFNLAVAAACNERSAPAWLASVSSLLRRAEAVVTRLRPRQLHLGAETQELAPWQAWRIPSALPTINLPELSERRRVLEVDACSLSCASFFCEHLQRGRPVLIHGHLQAQQWGALDYFSDLRSLYRDAGGRLVPVSLGSPLVGYSGVEHWPLSRLIEEHLLPSNATHDAPRPEGLQPDEETNCRVVYMSQHHLLHQHPALQALLAVPPYTLGREMSPANLWIGTRGTVTSLHSDPSDNLLCQVAGFKYFRLYALDQTPLLHATTLRAKNTNSFGTSPVRLEAPLPPEHASVAQAEYIEGLLAPGDMLFLPKSMWHYVRSLTTSVSVNFWF
jgi:hypothetical protein